MPNHHDGTVLIVGASAAGLAAATALRRLGHKDPITLLGDESEPPYDRPPLSKELLAGEWDDNRIRLASAERLAALDLDLQTGAMAESLDTAARAVIDQRGRSHAYDHLIIATGLRPRRPALASEHDMHVLRTLADVRRLRKSIRRGRRVAVVGAGFLGLETAATARQMGASVTVIEPVTRPLANRLGPAVAHRLIAMHEAHGVAVRTGTTVEAVARSGEAMELALSSGEQVNADTVVVCVGAEPCTEWLAGSGLAIDDGVVCDERSRATERVWAAGDVARWLHLGYGRTIRVEHRTNATEQGRHVARGILGDSAPYLPVPFFWTDHFGDRIQVAGQIGPESVETDVPVEGRPNTFLKLFHENGQLVAALGWNAPRELNGYRRELLAAMTREAIGA